MQDAQLPQDAMDVRHGGKMLVDQRRDFAGDRSVAGNRHDRASHQTRIGELPGREPLPEAERHAKAAAILPVSLTMFLWSYMYTSLSSTGVPPREVFSCIVLKRSAIN